jgi:ABC-2 type transport system permease protein
MASRHVYLFRRSPLRLLEMVYWPLLDLVLWGFVSIWLRKLTAGGPADVLALFLGGLILWDLLFRAQQGVSLAYLEEVWSRNLMNLFVSPLTVGEFLASTMLVSLGKLTVSGGAMLVLAWACYGYSLFSLGLALLPCVALLVAFGWALGTVTTALVLRFGQGAESLVWVLAFAIQPIACVFYPLETLPAWLQPVALATPAAHVFEAMRAVAAGGPTPWGHLAAAAALDVAAAVAAWLVFRQTFALARERGLLAKTGE